MEQAMFRMGALSLDARSVISLGPQTTPQLQPPELALEAQQQQQQQRFAIAGNIQYCRYFNRPAGGCRNGDRCAFVHERLACRDFNSANGCIRGANCSFTHKPLRQCQHLGCLSATPFLYCDAHRIRTTNILGGERGGSFAPPSVFSHPPLLRMM